MSHSLAPSEISPKLNAGTYGRQIGRIFKKGKSGIHGPPMKGSTDHPLVKIFKEDEGVHGPSVWLKFLKGMKGSTERRFVQILKAGMHRPPFGSEFLNEDEGSTDRRFGWNF